MTRNLLFCLLLLVGVVQGVQAQEPYAALSSDNTTLTFYYDNQKESREGMSVGPFDEYNAIVSWIKERKNIQTVIFDASFANCTSITSTAWWFGGFKKLEKIEGIENLKTDNVTDMSCMFAELETLTSLDLSSFNTAKVMDMSEMFVESVSLTNINLSSFSTSNVTNMKGMFADCPSLTSLDLSNFNTSNVTNMEDMFRGCKSMKSLNLSSFNTANVTTMRRVFEKCNSLTSLDLSNFNTAKVTDMRKMFSECERLTTIYCNDTWSSSNSELMFDECYSLVGAIAYDATKTDATYANPDTGYFTRKGETAITAPNKVNGQQQGDAWYNLGGQCLGRSQKGINIIGGKKMLLK